MNKSDAWGLALLVMAVVTVTCLLGAYAGWRAGDACATELQAMQAEAAQWQRKAESNQALGEDCKGDLKSCEEMFKNCDGARNRCEDALARLSLCQEQLQKALRR